MRLAIITLGVLVGLAAPAPAGADDAETLFRRGVDAMEAGRYAEACSALADSYRLDPRSGALFTLAECRAKEGKVATAVALYDEYIAAFAGLSPAEQARHREREKIASEKKKMLGPRVPRLVLRLPPGVDATVTRDDVTLRPAALGLPLPVDPGEHQLTTRVEGRQVHSQTVTIAVDEEKVVELEVAPRREEVRETPKEPALPAAAPPSSRTSYRPVSFTMLGLGAAGLVVGAATGGAALAKRGIVNSNCVNRVCSATGVDAANSGKTLGGVSTGSFVVGAAGVVVAAILLLTDRPASEPPRQAASWWPSITARVDKSGTFIGAGRTW
jgi:hypothetical protein